MALERLFTLLERLNNLTQASLRAAGQPHDLQPVPLLVLSYLAKANAYSDTPAAVADYLGLSRAAVSQTVGHLEERRLLARRTDAKDRRVRHLALTRAGQAVVDAVLPPNAWRDLATHPPDAIARLSAELEGLLRGLQAANGGRSFGVCRTCRHFLSEDAGSRCGLTGEPLAAEQTARICREHEDALAAAVP